jgi:DNA-binding NarL/FixJ family response regulator
VSAGPRIVAIARRTRVLVVDDYPCSRAALAALLTTDPDVELAGVASDGAEAVAMAALRHPDVVLMDVRMPVMDGLDATRAIKAACPSVKVVLLSVCAAYRDEALAAGADAFLVKGGPADDLLDAVTPPGVGTGTLSRYHRHVRAGAPDAWRAARREAIA